MSFNGDYKLLDIQDNFYEILILKFAEGVSTFFFQLLKSLKTIRSSYTALGKDASARISGLIDTQEVTDKLGNSRNLTSSKQE